MFPTLLRFGQVLMVVALLATSGGHWLVLQSVAWTGMLLSYSQHADFSEAVARTFDGQHPCALCKTIERGKKSEEPVRVIAFESKAFFVVPVVVRMIRNAGISWEMALPEVQPALRFVLPAVPPPRAVAV